jgi:hypothetical protein
LLELFFKYSEQVDQVEREDEDDDEDEDQDEEEKEMEFYLKKLEHGLFALQSIVYIIMDVYVNGNDQVMEFLIEKNVLM